MNDTRQRLDQSLRKFPGTIQRRHLEAVLRQIPGVLRRIQPLTWIDRIPGLLWGLLCRVPAYIWLLLAIGQFLNLALTISRLSDDKLDPVPAYQASTPADQAVIDQYGREIGFYRDQHRQQQVNDIFFSSVFGPVFLVIALRRWQSGRLTPNAPVRTREAGGVSHL